MPMREAAKQFQLSDVGLKKMCRRMTVPVPPQGYWSTPPDRRENFLERASRSQTAGVILEEFKTANSEEEILISPFIGLFGS
jgi:hypothetical protein